MSHADANAVSGARALEGRPAGDSVAIRVRGVGKSYQIYEAPRDRLKQFLLPRLQAAVGARPRRYYREFNALRDISFDVRSGETVGIIGRNGAGKSTLLQIICGTLTPTSGTVEFNGRVAALLELGSGFNAEFTGRENVRMNAGFLGLSTEEIDARFDAIVAFADIGDFIDRPLKTYSSGMAIRLAFAVVVHVDADILIVDEALSVGDLYFQAKCMAHMKMLMAQGISILFVSHDVGAVKTLCQRAIYLDHGVVVAIGPTSEIIDLYYADGVNQRQALAQLASDTGSLPAHAAETTPREQREFDARAAFQRIQNHKARFLDVHLIDGRGSRTRNVCFGERVVLRMHLQAEVDLSTATVAYHIRDRNGMDVVYSDTAIEGCDLKALRAGDLITMDWEMTMNLRQGDYTISAMLSVPEDLSIGKVEVCDFVPLAENFGLTRGDRLPIYGAAYWPNKVTQRRSHAGK